MRFLLYLTLDEGGNETQYLIDRKNDYWYIPPNTLHFPITLAEPSKFHTRTLLDGELVLDKDKKNDGSTVEQPRYMVFDCMVMDGKPLLNRTLDKRLAYCQENIMKPYKKLLREFPEELPHQHFLVEMKAFEMSYGTEMMFKERLPGLNHGNDGLVFTCRETPYQHGTDQHILKWKPEDENSVDFRMSLVWPMIEPDAIDMAEGITKPYPDYDAMPTFDLFVFNGGGKPDTWFGSMMLDANEWAGMKSLAQPLDDRIVECYMDEKKQWRFMRFRDDKVTGNHSTTVDSVIESIRDRVTEKDLVAAAADIKHAWKAREKAAIEGQRGPPQQNLPPPQPNGKRKAEEQGGGRPSPAPPGNV